MKAKTRLFGDINIADEKLIILEKGMIGFPNLTHFALIFDEEKGIDRSNIMWLQSMNEPEIVFPVMLPTKVKDDYNPTVSDEILDSLGNLTHENTFILVTVTVPKKIEDFSVNLKAPVIINVETNKGVQIIVEDDFPVKFKVYELLKNKKEKAGE